MKKALLVVTLLALASQVMAQITITTADMPASGDEVNVTLAVSTSIDLKLEETGANHTWNYTNLVTLNEDVVVFNKATTINSLYIFFGLNAFGKLIFDEMSLGAITITDIYDFYKNSSSNFKAVGRGISFNGQAIPSFYTNDDKIYEFPVAFGDDVSDEFSVAFALPGLITLTQSGIRTTVVDGWGTITTPYETYNCIRVKSTIDQVNKIENDFVPFPIEIPSILVEYKWLAKGEMIPVLEIRGTEVLGNFVPNYVAYRSEEPIVESTNDVYAATLTIYPNPMVNRLNITSNQANLELITIVDVNGKTLYTGTENTIDVSAFNKGIYFVTVKTTNDTYIRKVVKQ